MKLTVEQIRKSHSEMYVSVLGTPYDVADTLLPEIDRLTKENEQLRKTLEDVRMLATYPMQD